MKSNTKLSTSMTVTEFDNGYWYATELKAFAESIGIPFAARLRKYELEKGIKVYLATGKIEKLVIGASRVLRDEGKRESKSISRRRAWQTCGELKKIRKRSAWK